MDLKAFLSVRRTPFMLAAAAFALTVGLMGLAPNERPAEKPSDVTPQVAQSPAQLVAQYFPPGSTDRPGMPYTHINQLDSEFPVSFAEPLRIRSYKARVAAKPLKANPASTVQVEEDESRIYRDAFPGCDVVYHKSRKRIEEFVIVKEEGATKRSWTWELDLGTDAQRLGALVNENGSVKLVDRKGIGRMYIDPPMGKDAKGFELTYGDRLSYAMLAKPEGKFELTLNADLTGCSYPVVIDPTWRAAPRIIDGTNVPEANFPTVGQVGDTSSLFCTGTLIAPDCVLTAGHCHVDDGGSLLTAHTDGRFLLGGVTYETTQIIVHPTYVGFQAEQEDQFDMIIMKLSTSVTGVTPTPLYRQAPTVGQTLTLAGFGEQGTGLGGRDGTFPTNGTINFGTTPIDAVTDTFIKWNFEANFPAESNTAPGDSGGPSFITVDTTLYIAGVTSGGREDNAGFGDVSFNPRVDKVVDWIDMNCGTSGSGNSAPLFTSAASASNQGPKVNESVDFTATAQDPDLDTVTYSWNFGDGSTEATGANVSHAFAAAGIYTVIVTASDGNGGTATSSVDVVVANATMLLTKGLANLKFNRPGKDKTVIVAALTFDQEITLAGATIGYNIGGISGTVTLDEKERSPRGANVKVKIKIRRHKKGTAVPANTDALVTVMVKNGDFVTEGLSLGGIPELNIDTDRAGVAATLDATLEIGAQSFSAVDAQGFYKAKADRNGKFKL